jgi:RNA polymerase sigma-70 factor (ECF subfamily)
VARWLEAARRGAPEALGGLLEHFRQYLLLVANRHVPRDVRAKVGPSDLVQETLLRAQRRFSRFHGRTEGDLRLWLRRILRNQLANVTRHYRGTGKRQVAREFPLAEAPRAELAHGLVAPTAPPGAEVIAREEGDQLRRALDRLPGRYRRVIEWRNFEQLSFADIGRRLGRSPEAARMLWARAVERLGQALGPSHEPG